MIRPSPTIEPSDASEAIAPQWWVRNDIWKSHTAYLARYEQKHGQPPHGDHHGIPANRVEASATAGTSSAYSGRHPNPPRPSFLATGTGRNADSARVTQRWSDHF